MELMKSQLDTEVSSFLPHWRELSDFLKPRRARFSITEANKGNRINNKIIDSSASFALRTLSSGMMSGMTSPARPWFRLTTPDPDMAEFGPVKDWLHVVTQRMITVFLRSNLYNALPTMYSDLGGFGTSAMAVMEDDENVIRCFPFGLGSYRLANDSKLRVRVFAREFRMSVQQVVEKFAVDGSGNLQWGNISPNVKNLWDRQQYQEWIDIVHVICPNSLYDGILLASKFKKFTSVYYEKGAPDDKFLEEKGFDEFPILAPRWETTAEDVYGTDCPGMMALGDIKQLQLGEKRSMQAIDKMVTPPMVAPTAMRQSAVTVLPGQVTYLDTREGQQGFKPAYEVRPQIRELEMKQEQKRFLIRRAFFEDLFLMLASNPNLDQVSKTAREIEERHEEKLLALGPVLEQLNQDALDPLIDRTFAVMNRRGYIPPPTSELEGSDLKVEYLSIMSQAQKMIGLGGLERTLLFVTNAAQVNPQIVDKFDFDQAVDEYAEMTGVPPRIVVPDEMVNAIRQKRAAAQEAAQQATTMKDASTAAKNLSQSDTEGKNALTDMLKGVSSGQNPGNSPVSTGMGT
jgi:hypothetical protein